VTGAATSGQELPDVRVAPPGPRSRELATRLAAVESPAFDARREAREKASGAEQAPIVYAEGRGANVVDVDGNRYVDLVAGFGALVLGHRPDRVSRAVAAQHDKLWLALGDVYASEAKVALCERLAKLGPPGARVLLGLSGADAVTAALKTAMLATEKPGVVAFTGAYHGLGYAPLAACGLQPSFRAPFAAQLGDHVVFAPYPSQESELDASLSAVRAAMKTREVGAVLVEPILGRGGCVVPPSGFLRELRRACDESGALLIADEIWTGLGRSGSMLASGTGTELLADVVCIGKGLGAGIPISACIGTERAMQAWGAHGGATIHTATHFGSPVACAAALATLDVLADDSLAARAGEVGARWVKTLRTRSEGRGVRDVRGRGLMVGIELDGDGGRALATTRALLRAGWITLTGGAKGSVITLTPPLDIDEQLLDTFAGALARALTEAA
jgi:4-aminobutyrate aminotransferase / (S)-3-amino-2-methylpropionate transaminase / 5-aminovalerate transaminase